MEAIELNLIYSWFLDLSPELRSWTPEAFSVNSDRCLERSVVRTIFDWVEATCLWSRLVGNEYFTVDGLSGSLDESGDWRRAPHERDAPVHN